MATPIKAAILRLPSRPAVFAAGCCASRATLSTTARPVTLKSIQFRPQQNPRSPSSYTNTITSRIQQLRHSSAQAAPANPSTAEQPEKLDWNTFFKLRLRRRRIQVFFSVTMSAVGLVTGVVLLSTGMAEPLLAQIPLDPFISLGLMTMTFAGAGWLIGPSIGSQVFYMMNGRLRSQIHKKEAEFFARIRKNRVDPSNSSAANPVPDFYGERIQSVTGYRQWLKDQRAFNRKKAADLI